MKKEINHTVNICDLCSQVSYYNCSNCNVDMCHDCVKHHHGKSYNSSLYFSTAQDGFYCKKCDDMLSKSKSDKLYNAYKDIQNLKLEMLEFDKCAKNKAKILEANLLNLYKKLINSI